MKLNGASIDKISGGGGVYTLAGIGGVISGGLLEYIPDELK